MSSFKPGDKVLCIRPFDNLKLNGLYTVKEYSAANDLVYIEEAHNWFVGYRFKLAEHLEPFVNTQTAYFIEADGLPEQRYQISSEKQDQANENLTEIQIECQKAMFDWPEFHTAHEGYAVLLEEVDELWDEVKKKPKNRDSAKMKAECIQIAAMALRFATEICDTKKGNN